MESPSLPIVEVESRTEDAKFLSYHAAASSEQARGAAITDVIDTEWGVVHVTRSFDHLKPKKPIVLTYHDIALNHGNSFQSFIHQNDCWKLFQHFQFIHIDAPGHQAGSEPLTDTYPPLSISSLCCQINAVMMHYQIKYAFGFGIGAGATLLLHFQLRFQKLLGLILVGPSARKPTFSEWAVGKACTYGLEKFGFHWTIEDQLLGRLFPKETIQQCPDLLNIYSRDMRLLPVKNINAYWRAILNREDITAKLSELSCPLLIFVGKRTSVVEEAIIIAEKVEAGTAEVIEIPSECLLLTEVCPEKLLIPIQLFFAGMGYNYTIK